MKIPFFLTIISLLLWAFISAAQKRPNIAPVNPELVKYLEQKKSGDGESYKLIPPPVEPISRIIRPDKLIRRDLPAYYNLQDDGYLTPVRDQLSAYTCWAFATMAAIESRWLKLGYPAFDLSENHLKNHKNVLGFLGDINLSGGNFMMSTAYLSSLTGPVTEADDPYDPTGTTIPAGLNPLCYVTQSRFLPNHHTMDPQILIPVIKQFIYDYGALYTNMYYQNTYFDTNTYTYYYSGNEACNHAISLVGWDDNKITQAPNPGAWIVKNSDGPGWGDNGYFYLSYQDAAALHEIAMWPERTPFEPGAIIHRIDNAGSVGGIGFDDQDYCMIEFTAGTDQQITRLGTWIYEANENATVSFRIYDGSLHEIYTEVTGLSTPYAGYYTFDLPGEVAIRSGETFYVEAGYACPNSISGSVIPIEDKIPGYCDPPLETGRTYISDNGIIYFLMEDMIGQLADGCIRAYALPASLPPELPAPTNLVAEAGNSQADLKWDRPLSGDETEWAYDDGGADVITGFTQVNGDAFFGVRFASPQAVSLCYSDLYLRNVTDTGQFREVLLVGESGGNPDLDDIWEKGTVRISPTTTRGQWFSVDFPDYPVAANTPFYLLFKFAGAGDYIVGRDDTGPDGASCYTNDGGANWTHSSSFDIMFRAYVRPSGSVNNAVLLPPASGSPTGMNKISDAGFETAVPLREIEIAGEEMCRLPVIAGSAAEASGNGKNAGRQRAGAPQAYRVYRGENPGGPFSLVEECQSENYTDITAQNGRTCHYAVTAVYSNPAGESGYSNIVKAMPHPPVSFAYAQVISSDVVAPQAVYGADLDGDGDLDALSASYQDNKIAWYQNSDGQGNFSGQNIVDASALKARCVLAADVDGDNDLDIVAASWEDHTIAWYPNSDGNGSFGPKRIISTEARGPYWIDCADLDGDGDPDIVSASQYDMGRVAWFQNIDGAGTFGSMQLINVPTYNEFPDRVCTADPDNDGDPDVLVVDNGNYKVSWFENRLNAGGGFGPEQRINDNCLAAVPADVNGDGDTDVLSIHSAHRLAWQKNLDGRGHFSIPYISGSNSLNNPDLVLAADMDGDGDMDALAGEVGYIRWFENKDGLGSFGPKQLVTWDDSANDIFAGDFDGDGDPDVLAALYGLNQIALYRNEQPTFIGDNRPGRLPDHYRLFQNYPNPFNPVTTIRFMLPRGGIVHLELYNSLGQRVAVLLNGYKPAGVHTLQFSGANLPSGIYYYRIRTAKFQQIRKMLLLK